MNTLDDVLAAIELHRSASAAEADEQDGPDAHGREPLRAAIWLDDAAASVRAAQNLLRGRDC